MKLSPGEKIINEAKFLASHKAIIEANKGKSRVKPYELRLKKYLELR